MFLKTGPWSHLMILKVIGIILIFGSLSTFAENPVQPNVPNSSNANNSTTDQTSNATPTANSASPTSTPSASAPSASILAKSQVCAACHGVDGNSTTPIWPKIAGQHEKYLIKELISFKKADKGGRNDPSMVGMVQNLSDQD